MVTRVKEPGRTRAIPEGAGLRTRVLILEARFYEHLADALVEGAIAEIQAAGATWERIAVPGALEIPQALALAAVAGLIPESAANARFGGAVALGCVIRGETSHYDIVCNTTNTGLMDVALRHHIPVGNGILTVENETQALARARGGREGKGGDAARACLRLIALSRAFVDASA